jgi:hypothetical protein
VLADGGRREGVGLDDVRPCLKVLAVDIFDDLRLGEEQEFVVALEILALPIGETRTSKRGLIELETLDHGPHGAVEDDNPLAEQRLEGMNAWGKTHGGSHVKNLPGPCRDCFYKSSHPDALI